MVIVGDSYNREYLVMMDLQSQLHFNNQKMLSRSVDGNIYEAQSNKGFPNLKNSFITS